MKVKAVPFTPYLSATHACPSFDVNERPAHGDSILINERWEPCVFLKTSMLNGTLAYHYISVLPCTCAGAMIGGRFHTYEPLPEWGCQAVQQ